MSTKVEQASTTEHGVQTTVTATSSAASTSSSKISMFSAKSGFVIPKNKLSGSLVPIFRGGKKLVGRDAASEESTKQVQRKTKWGPDLTQDAAVRKARALTYQARVDQITQQLKPGIWEIGVSEDLPLASHNLDGDTSGHQVNSEKSELLELERREAIGEILKLNPSYKAPADYKPLLKEDKVPIPIKEYPGYNFIGLILGSASDTQKRLEKETGAKIRVYGTKTDTGDKVEITPSDANETHSVYEELYVHVCADTYEKVDAAVDLIELLVTPVSVNPVAVSTTSTAVSGDNLNVIHLSQGTPTPYTVPPALVNQGVAQPIIGSGQALPLGQFQPYPSPWFPTGPSSGFIAPRNPSAPIHSSLVQVSSPLNPTNMPSLFGPRPVLALGFGSVPQNSFVPSRPQPIQQVLQHPYMPRVPSPGYTGPPRNPPMPALLSMTAQPNISAPPPFTSNQPTPTGPPQNVRPLLSSLHQSASPGIFLDRPLVPVGSSIGWSQAPAGTLASLGPNNMAQMAPSMVTSRGPHPVASQPIVVSGPPPLNVTASNMVSPITLPFRPSATQSFGAVANRPVAAPAFSSVPQPQMGLSPASSSLLTTPAPSPSPAHSSNAPMQPVMVWPVLANPVLGSTQIRSPVASTSTQPPPPQSRTPSSVSGSAPSFTPIKPPSVTAPKPQHPSSTDFTFQPHRPQNPASQLIPGLGSRPAAQNMPPQNLTMQPLQSSQTPAFRPAIHHSAPSPVMEVFPRSQVSIQMNQPRTQMSLNSPGNPTGPHPPVRHPAFPNTGPATPTTPVPQMGLRNFSPAPQMVDSAGPFPPRPGNPMQLQKNYPAMATQPQRPLAPNHRFSSNQPFPSSKPASIPSGPQQIYDPFSPTSVAVIPQLAANTPKVTKQESDPEYEDLMASVGVK